MAPSAARGEVAIALVSDRRIRELNRQFRGKDAPTDVLSFTSHPDADHAAPSGPAPLGDIVISTQTARRQARENGHTYGRELKVLALHGLLHLLGYDHHDPDDRGRMRRLERRLRVKGGLHASLIERADRASTAAGSRRSLGEGGRAPRKRRAGAQVGESGGRSRSRKT